MTTFENVLREVFDRGAERRLSLADEREAIAAAKLGDEAATLALIHAYASTLRRTAARHTATLGRDEARQAAVVGLLEAVAAFDLSGAHDRLAAIVFEYVIDAVQSASGSTVAISVPSRTLKRFFGILRRADGDVDAALALAPSFDMAPETFLAVLAALRTDSLDEARVDTSDRVAGAGVRAGQAAASSQPENGARPLWGEDSGHADTEDRILAETALASVDDFSADVCRLAYGFTEADPIPDAEIGHRLGGFTRSKIQRTRTAALDTMRDSLGV